MVSLWRSCPHRHSFPPRPRVCPTARFLCCSEASSGNQRSCHKFSFQVMTMFSANRDNNPKFWQCIAFVISGVLWWELTILAVRYLPEISQPFACKLLSYILVRTWCTRENCFILSNIATIELSWIPVSTQCQSPPPSSSAGS